MKNHNVATRIISRERAEDMTTRRIYAIPMGIGHQCEIMTDLTEEEIHISFLIICGSCSRIVHVLWHEVNQLTTNSYRLLDH